MAEPEKQEEKQEEERHFLLCLRVADAHPEAITDGALKYRCGTCQEAIWVSGSGQNMLKSGEMTPENLICNQCLKKMQSDESPDDPLSYGLRPEMLHELFEQIVIDGDRRGHEPKELFDFLQNVFDVIRRSLQTDEPEVK